MALVRSINYYYQLIRSTHFVYTELKTASTFLSLLVPNKTILELEIVQTNY